MGREVKQVQNSSVKLGLWTNLFKNKLEIEVNIISYHKEDFGTAEIIV